MAGLVRGFRRTLANDRNLRPFVIEARPTGKQLGTGSYGSVEEVEVNGLICAAKKIHEILLDVGNVGVQRIASMFVQECQLMSDLRHPNVTLFIGLCFVPNYQLPLLVMERLDGNIDDLLESVPDIPLALKRSMLEDIARGLLYLHSRNPQIVHRDLTAKNVLLTSLLVAKITDLGNSRIVNLQPGQLAQTLSQNPGTLAYMPPEALTNIAHYGPSLDVFSFGHLCLFVGTQVFPGKLLEPTYADPGNRHRLLGRSEYERRSIYVDQLNNKLPTGEHHPFVQLISRCLQNDPSDRPTAGQLLTALVEMKEEVDGPYGDFAKLDALKQVATMKALKGKDSVVRGKTAELAAKEVEIQQLHQELEQIQVEKVDVEAQYQRHLQEKDSDLLQKEAEIQRCSSQLRQKEIELQQRSEQLQQRELELQQKNLQLLEKDQEVCSLRLLMQTKEDKQKNLCKFPLFCRHPDTNELIKKYLEIHKDETLQGAVIEAHKLLDLEGIVPVKCCRLVRYYSCTEILDQSFEEQLEMPTFGHHVGGARDEYEFELFLEICREGERFYPYNQGGLNLCVAVVDLPSATVREPICMRGEQIWTVHYLKTEIAKRLSLSGRTMNLALESGKHLSNPDNLLKDEGLFTRHTVYVCCDPGDFKKSFRSSGMYQIIDKCRNSILLYITIPPLPKNKQTKGYKPHQRTINVRIEKQCTLAELKKKLEEYYLFVPSSEFKIYRIYSNNQEYELFRLQDTLESVPNETMMTVRLGRALKPGEFRAKLSLLEIHKPQFFKPVLDSIIVKGMTVRQFKEQIVKELYEQAVDIPLKVSALYVLNTTDSISQTLYSRIRLRKKTWRSPATIFLDSQVFDRDIRVFSNFEMYIECLDDPDQMMKPTQIQVYVRHWHPSTYTVDKTQEIILSDNSPDSLKVKLSELSDIPVERIEFAKAYGSFPCEISVLAIESELEWNPTVTTISSMPLSIYDDGSILYFKDSKEQLMKLSPGIRKEIEEQESQNERLIKYDIRKK